MTGFRECWYVIERGMGKSEEFLSPPPEGPHSWAKRRSHAMVWRTYEEAKRFLDARQGPGVLEGARLGYIDPAMAVHVQAPTVPAPSAFPIPGPGATRSPQPASARNGARRRAMPKSKRKTAGPKKPPRAKRINKKRRKAR